ncbi:uncharacterized protein A4U43_C06F15350 [Asparagus officinalis]|uniref:Uncharacterized protein n=1 Tax=Asparagus officinalis TaxID=4686 RepID=A0A5P1ESN6_ASPOF|nr:uncharacterized protein A4U43_C06F15350 [Asparagus officinalis]
MLGLWIWLCWPVPLVSWHLVVLAFGLWLCWPVHLVAWHLVVLASCSSCFPLPLVAWDLVVLASCSSCLSFGWSAMLLVLFCAVGQLWLAFGFMLMIGLCFNFVHGFNLLSALVSALGWPLGSMSFQPPAGPSTAVSNGGRGSMGPVIGVLAVILALAVVAAIVGRLCSGRSVFGYGHFDVEGWIERKCASCIDGRIESGPPPPHRATRNHGGF